MYDEFQNDPIDKYDVVIKIPLSKLKEYKDKPNFKIISFNFQIAFGLFSKKIKKRFGERFYCLPHDITTKDLLPLIKKSSIDDKLIIGYDHQNYL